MTISRSKLAAAGVLMAVAVSGCGGGSGADFKSGFRQQNPSLSKLGSDIAAALDGAGSKGDPELGTEFAGLSQRAGQVLGKLQGLKPGRAYRSTFATLTSGLAEVQHDLATLAGSARTHSPTSARTTAVTLVQHATSLQSANTQLQSELGIK